MAKKLAEFIVAWLCGHYQIYPIDACRIRRGSDAVARGHRWEAFYKEENGLAEMLATIRRGYFERAGQLKPGDIAGLQALSVADRICAEIDGAVRLIIVEGDVAAQAQQHADKIAALPEAMRRRL